MKINEFLVPSQHGEIFIKKWTPSDVKSEVPVILLHDSLGSVDLWKAFPVALANHLAIPVIAYDRLGFGKSEERKDLLSINFIEEEADIYFPVVKASLEINDYILLGHSVGGAMAVNIAASDKACKAVITISAQAFVEKLTIQGIQNAKQMFQESGQLDRLMKWHGEKAEWVLKAWTDTWLSPAFSTWKLNNLQNVHCPLLAIHGEDDEYGSIAFPKYIVENAGGCSQMEIINHCGHMPHKTNSEHVLVTVMKFINY